jgi:hypothetical protein
LGVGNWEVTDCGRRADGHLFVHRHADLSPRTVRCAENAEKPSAGTAQRQGRVTRQSGLLPDAHRLRPRPRRPLHEYIDSWQLGVGS